MHFPSPFSASHVLQLLLGQCGLSRGRDDVRRSRSFRPGVVTTWTGMLSEVAALLILAEHSADRSF